MVGGCERGCVVGWSGGELNLPSANTFFIAAMLLWDEDDNGTLLFHSVIYNSVTSTNENAGLVGKGNDTGSHSPLVLGGCTLANTFSTSVGNFCNWNIYDKDHWFFSRVIIRSEISKMRFVSICTTIFRITTFLHSTFTKVQYAQQFSGKPLSCTVPLLRFQYAQQFSG